MAAPKKFLVIQTAFIGDVVLGLVVPQALKTLFPEAEIDYLVRKGNEGLAQNHPALRQVLLWDKKQGKLRNLWKRIRAAQQEKYDAVLNLHRFASSGLITAFSGAEYRIGFSKNPLSRAYTHAFPHIIGQKGDPNPLHEVDRNLQLIRPFHLGPIPQEWRRPRLYPSAADEAKVAEYRSRSPYYVLAPASVWFTKQWPAAKWQELAAVLAEKGKVFLIGAPSDVALCEIVKAGHANVEILAGKLSLLQSAALMKGAARVYANDSAPLHFASAVNAPATAIFCSTVPEFGFGPLSEDSAIWQENLGLGCRPCGLHGHSACPQRHFKCAKVLQLPPP